MIFILLMKKCYGTISQKFSWIPLRKYDLEITTQFIHTTHFMSVLFSSFFISSFSQKFLSCIKYSYLCVTFIFYLDSP